MTDNLAEAVERVREYVETFPDEADCNLVDPSQGWGPTMGDLRTILSSLKGDEEMVARLRETIVDLWHDSKADHGSLHECMGMSWDEYAAWVNPISVIGE